MSKLSLASKIVLGGGVLLLIDSFLQWQRICFGAGGFSACGGVSAWGGSGSWAGLLMGIALIVLLIWEAVQLAGAAGNLNLPVSPSKASAYLGFAVVVFGVLKLIIVLTSPVKPSLFGWLGLVLILAVGYGSWMKFQEPEGAAAPPPPVGGGDSGFTA